MGESDRYQDYKKPGMKFKIPLGQDGNALTALFTINVIFLILLLTLQVVYFFFQQSSDVFFNEVVRWFALPASAETLITRPWTLLTYMFSDTGDQLIRVASNMLWLWAFGYVFQEMTGNKKLIPVYIYGGLAGAVVFIAANYLIPGLNNQLNTDYLLGANAATMSVAMATTALSPNHKFFTMIRGGISIWVLMAVYILIDLAGVATYGAAHSLSHIAGALAGFLFIYFLKKDKDGSLWMNSFYHRLVNLFTPEKKSRASAKETIFYKTGGRQPYNKTSIITQQRVDEILDKINQKGYNSLNEEEKQILKKAAEEEL